MLICLLTFPIISHNLANKVVKDAIGCHLLLDTQMHRSVQGCCCIQGLLRHTRGTLLFSLFYGIFPLSYCTVSWQKVRDDYYPNYKCVVLCVVSIVFCFNVNVKNNTLPTFYKRWADTSVGSVVGGEIVTTLCTSKKLTPSLS